jgi:AraC-like DNA-binding protein
MPAACLMERSTSLIRDPGARPALSPALASVRLEGVVFAAADLSPPWGVVMPRVPDQVAIYIHTQGSGLAVFNEPQRHIRLEGGDLLMVKGAVWHGMSDQPGRVLQPLARVMEDDGRFVADSDDEVFSTLCRLRLGETRAGAGSATTKVLTLRAFTEPRAPSPLLQSLPDAVHLPGFWWRHQRFMESLLAPLGDEMAGGLIGQRIASRLGEVVLMKVIQTYVEQLPEGQRGLAGGLKDRYLSTAINALYSCPGRAWTVDALAAQVGLSRSAFLERFTTQVGQTPSQFLTAVRMQRAMELVQHSVLPLARVGDEVGYGSEAAFNRAFTRWCGETPGGIRRAGRSEQRCARPAMPPPARAFAQQRAPALG